jgi:signal transduction histidine kinase
MLKRERDHKLLNAQAITASIAHEVRQPLGSIVASGETALIHLTKTPIDTEGLHRSLNRIINDGYRASEVLESIRTLFRNHPYAVPQRE